MLLRTSRQRWGCVGLHGPTGEPIEGRLVGVIPTKTLVGGRASRKGALVACVIGSSFKSSLFAFCVFRMSTLGRKICEYAVADSLSVVGRSSSRQSGIICRF